MGDVVEPLGAWSTGTLGRSRLAEVGITRGVILLCVTWLVVFGPVVSQLSAQSAPRLAFTGALVDDRDVRIDGYLVDYDRSERDGHVYSDKAPGQGVMAVPFYITARAVGAEPAIVPRVTHNLTLWWLTFWSAGVPAMALTMLIAMAAHQRGTPIPLGALTGLVLGTMILPFSTNLYGQVLAACLGFSSWRVLDRSADTWRRGAAAGVLSALAVTVEYPMLIVAVVLGAWLVVRRRWQAVLGYALGAVPVALALMAYHQAAHGSPFAVSYHNKEPLRDSTLLVTGLPQWEHLIAIFAGSRGLIFTPVVLVGLAGLVVRYRRRREDAALVAMVIVAGFVLLQAGWPNPWGGWSPGPRYLTPMLPFLGLGLAQVWMSMSSRVRQVVLGVSVVTMVLASVTEHEVRPGGVLIGSHLRAIRDYGLHPTVWSISLGRIGWVLHGVSTVLAVFWLLRVIAIDEKRPDPLVA